jgi:hypothetical protein
MYSFETISSVRDGLIRAMESGEVQPRGPELLDLAIDLCAFAFPEWSAKNEPTSKDLDGFSLLVGHVAGSAVQKYEDLDDY